VHERAAEGVAGPEAAQRLQAHRLDLDELVRRAGEHALGPALDDRQAHAEVEQPLGGLERVARADRDLDLVAVAHRDGRVRERRPRLAAGLVGVGPEHRPVVEVVDRDPLAAGRERGERRRPARLGRQPGAGRPEHARGADRVEVELVGREREVGRRRLAVEEQREVVGRVDLAEREWGAQRRVRGDEARVDPEALEVAAQVAPERVVPDLRDHRRALDAEPRGGHRDVRRAAADRLGERVHVLEPHADLLRVEVDADAAHRDQVVGHVGSFVSISWVRTGRPSASERRAARPMTSGARASAPDTGVGSPVATAAAKHSHART
jgi:hypothetical protein